MDKSVPPKEVDIPSLDFKDRSGKLYLQLKSIFDGAATECKCQIIFRKAPDGSKSNPVMSEIISYTRKATLSGGKKLAARLHEVTTHRSGQGLLFMMRGIDTADGKRRIVLSRFRADTGIQADLTKGKLDIQFIDTLFMKNEKNYKAVVYEGVSDSSFWEGLAIDKQGNDSFMDMSNYWINEFLQSDFSLTPARGTVNLADAIRKVINGSDNLAMKHELTSAVALSESINGQTGNVEKLLTKLNVKEEYQKLIVEELGPIVASERFKFDSSAMLKFLSYKVIELDSGVFISAPTEEFDAKVRQSKSEDGLGIRVQLEGKIVNEKVKKSGV